MFQDVQNKSQAVRARLAGGFYLMTLVSGIFSEFFIRSHLVVYDSASKTAANILANQDLYRLGIASDLVMILSYIAFIYLLYSLFQSTQERMSRLAAFFGLSGCMVLAVNMINALAPLVIMTNQAAFVALSSLQMNDLSYLFVRLFARGYSVSLVFFGVYCLLVGWVIVAGQMIPKPIGGLIALAGVCYLLASTFTLVLPLFSHLNAYLNLGCLLGEVSLTLWLLIMGVKHLKTT